MKYYQIKKGIEGLLLTRGEENGIVVFDVKSWIIRRDLAFTETLLDPIRLYNNRDEYDPADLLTQYAAQGCAIFAGEHGCEQNAKYLLVVPYDSVQVN